MLLFINCVAEKEQAPSQWYFVGGTPRNVEVDLESYVESWKHTTKQCVIYPWRQVVVHDECDALVRLSVRSLTVIE